MIPLSTRACVHVSSTFGGLFLCGVPLRPRPPTTSRAELTEERVGHPQSGTSWAASRRVGGGPPWSSLRGTGRQREQYAYLKQNKHNLPFSAESEYHSESSGCTVECATVAGRPSLRAHSVIHAFLCLPFSAPRSSLRGQWL